MNCCGFPTSTRSACAACSSSANHLVVEILSPDDRPREVLGKVADCLSAGTRLVWVIDPERRLARTYRADGTEEVVTAEQALHGEDVVPSFACPLASIP